MSILLPFVIGAVISIITISYVLSWLMKEFRNETLSVLTGFMIGSLPVVYPWKEVLPGMFDYTFHLPTVNGEFIVAVVMAIIGASLVLVLSHYSKKKEERMKRREQRKLQRQLKKGASC